MELRARVEAMRGRKPEDVGVIGSSPKVLDNEPVIAGTRVPVAAIWNFHEAGYDTPAILQEYPQLHPEEIKRAIAYVAERQQRTA